MILLPDRELAASDPAAWYEKRIREETAAGEPELGLLPALAKRGGLALDVGANIGFYAYALSKWAGRVEAFEPNPDIAALAAGMLGDRAKLRVVAASNAPGRRKFRVPLSGAGESLHFGGNLLSSHGQFEGQSEYEVEAAPLDSFGFDNVCLLKADVEGHEWEVFCGAKQLIATSRPFLIAELLSGTHADPIHETRRICAAFGYEAFLYDSGALVPAMEILPKLASNTTWGTPYRTRNVLFTPGGTPAAP